ncbi:MAG TPA: sulfotransferase [Sphingomonadales bacterium]|nr:sulfotransferase [Sphingomonadales bacterium]
MSARDGAGAAHAIAAAETALKARPRDPGLLETLGRLYQDEGRFEDSLAVYRKILEANPQNPVAFHRLTQALLKTGRSSEAFAFVAKAAPAFPNNAFLWTLRAQTAQASERWEEAAENFQKLKLQYPLDLSIKKALADCLYNLDRAAELVPLAAELLQAEPSPEHFFFAAQVFHKLGDFTQAKLHLEEALKIRPDYPDALVNLGLVTAFAGELGAARALYERALALDPEHVEATLQLAKTGSVADSRASIQRLEALKASPGKRSVEHIGYALGQLYDAAGEFNRAFDNYRLANEAAAAHFAKTGSVYDPAAVDAAFQRVQTLFAKAAGADLRFEGSSEATPIFIFGMPRSGTTLLERIVSTHTRVFGAGELDGGNRLLGALLGVLGQDGGMQVEDALSEYGAAWCRSYLNALPPRPGGEECVTDKMPNNFFNFGLLRRLFPKAAFIHIRRNPLDTCLSIYFSKFNRHFLYATDLEALGGYYRRYHELMHHWRSVFPGGFLDVVYEDLVGNPEAEARKVLDHCRLDWQPQCLDFHTQEAKVVTLSVYQVRKPIYKTAVGRWQNYRGHLAPLAKGLGENVLREWRERGMADL